MKDLLKEKTPILTDRTRDVSCTVRHLTDAELLAVIIRSGTGGHTAIDLA